MKLKIILLAVAVIPLFTGCTTGLSKVVRELKNDPAVVHFSFQGWGASVVLDRSGLCTNAPAK